VTAPPLSAAEAIEILGLKPHPEGGHFRETFRDPLPDDGRGASTAILYLLSAGEVSAWHRVHDATELWHYHAGAPLLLRVSEDGSTVATFRLGSDLGAGERPQAIVPRSWWQAAESAGDWTLVGCTVAPGFDFAAFELAPIGWTPQPAPGGSD
jgi:predicted cupin superfamily sugar epimerase